MLYMKRFLTFVLLAALPLLAAAQKKPLDHDVYDGWQAVGGTTLSPSGKVISYAVNPQEGDGTLYIRVNGKKSARTIAIPRGYQVRLLDNDAFAVCLIKPEFQKTRRAKIKKLSGDKLPQDSLAIIDLQTGVIRKFPNVKSFQLGPHATQQFAFATIDTAFVKKVEKDMGTPVAVYHFADGHLDTLKNVDKYTFSKEGNTLALIQKTDKKHSVVGFYAGGETRMLTDTATFHAIPSFNEEGTEALYLQAKDTASTGSKHAALWLYDVIRDEARELVAADQRRNMPENWGLTENSTYFFSKKLGTIFAGIQEYVPQKDTNLVSFETAGLDIWNWNADEIPPRMKANLARDKRRTYVCMYQDESLIPFNTRKTDRLIFTDNYDAEVILEVSPANPVESQWNIQGEAILTLIFPGSGRRQEIARGAFDSALLSPKGKYAIWWDYNERAWFVYDVAAEQVRNITEGIDSIFWDEKDDHPMMPESYGLAAWTRDDESVILNDRYDLWRIHLPDGKANRLTQGREQRRTYRYISTKDSEEDPGIGPGETIYMRVFDEVTKENGLASYQIDPKKLNFKTLAFGGYTWDGLKKAKNAPVFAYQKGNLQEQMDLYVTDFGKSTEKLTAINPQQKDYNWATVELYHWTAFDGRALDGLLYKPEDFDPAKKYPVMIYFYETYSENLYKNIIVQPSWSTVNLIFYASRGYIVFVPDIVYTPGMPGQSAYNCIVSGAESLTKFPWVDKDNMAIQGQSWGGYQVAWLITRTNMFKAAGAGAPVSNMTSAYGGIRWESGMSRQFQYEQTQSRIGRDLWNGLELYLENSALFRLPNVQTPVLIMHNDNDGAVPWYQGIEMFMGLRRLGKPAWLLEYNDEAHNLRERRNRKDLTIRLQQFFDHYLKGAPEPAWMRDGIPTMKKDYYFGYEY
jgi:dipeptidyl aminopeptidase/acylaminoacyl peptidase